MNEDLFAELLESVREGGAILRGEKAPSRKFEIEAPGAKRIHERTEATQGEGSSAHEYKHIKR